MFAILQVSSPLGGTVAACASAMEVEQVLPPAPLAPAAAAFATPMPMEVTVEAVLPPLAAAAPAATSKWPPRVREVLP